MVHIDLAVPSYLRTYLISLFGDNYRVSSKDDLGILILNTLRKKSHYYKHVPKQDERSVYYSLHISMSLFEKYGCTLSSEQLFQIYKQLDSGFRRSLYVNAIVNKEYQSIPYKNSIENTLQAFGIGEDELSYSTIRKDFNRKKVHLQQRLQIKGHI